MQALDKFEVILEVGNARQPERHVPKDIRIRERGAQEAREMTWFERLEVDKGSMEHGSLYAHEPTVSRRDSRRKPPRRHLSRRGLDHEPN
jgi:hypothetical protein